MPSGALVQAAGRAWLPGVGGARVFAGAVLPGLDAAPGDAAQRPPGWPRSGRRFPGHRTPG
eukprot:65635-Alexandrium_andersonii.AAC.1